MAPVLPFSVRPAGVAVKLPPVVPVILTFICPPVLLHNNGDPYDMVAVGSALTVTPKAVAVPLPHGLTGVTVNVPAVAPVENVTVLVGELVLAVKLAPVPE